jgi:uncharacterized membrane protein required for colicin V production
MVTINFLFWFMVMLFGFIGAMRGWAKELLVTFSAILAMALMALLEKYIPFISSLPENSTSLFWVRTVIMITLVAFGYQTVNLPQFAGKARREKLADSLLGFFLGGINAYLIFGSIWYYMHMAIYPFPNIIAAPMPGTPQGDAALALVPYLPPRLLGEPLIYFAVMLAFIFVIVVYI